MKVSVDLHIHSGLSPCGHEDMTPNNIINMAKLKGLDVISITDHNLMENVAVTFELGKKNDILVIPGIEVTTKEEIHVLSYFTDLKKAHKFQGIIYNGLVKIPNNKETFGEQIIYDINDKKIGEVDCLLLSSTCYSIEEINSLTLELDGVMVPAHVDKKSFSIISAIGFIPKDLDINTIEVSKKCDMSWLEKIKDVKRYNIIVNSDAHYLRDISESVFFLHPSNKTVEAIIAYLRKGCENRT